MESYKHKVNYYETDKMGITHHSNYIRFMEEARVYFLEQIGWGYDKMEENGIVSPVVNVTCNYKRTTTFPNEIEVNVVVLKLSAAKLTLEYDMKVNGQTVCTAESSHCFLGQDGRPLIIEKAFPDFYAKLKEFLKA